jgi:predicted AlkP superfamily phosphohydrolase/phosphomutase
LRRDPAFSHVYLSTEFGAVDWSRTRAYGVGFTGLYLNLAGRERDDPATPDDEQGIVKTGAEADALVAEIRAKLEALVDEKTGLRVVRRCDPAKDVYLA